MDKISQEGLVRGRVQGVAYRAFCRRCAWELGITGYAQNLVDGSVRVGAYGPARQVAEFWNYLRQGPPLARIDSLDITDRASIGEPERFEIIF